VSDYAFPVAASRYRYVPLDGGQTAESLAATAKRLDGQAAQGWEFCGSVDMQLTAAELAALRAGHAAAKETAKEKRATHRVLVFRRTPAPTAAAVNPATGLADAAAAPISPEGMPPPALGDPAAQTPGGGFPAPGFGPSAGPAAAPPALGTADPSVPDGLPLPKAAAVGPATVIYRAKVAAAETLEKVAVDLAKAGRRGAVTAIADPRTASLILTGEANAIKEIVDRLEALEADLAGPKPPSTPGRQPIPGVNY
jgi:hypothetical protein